MRKVFALALSVLCVLALAACSQKADNSDKSSQTSKVSSVESKVEATNNDWREFAADYEKMAEEYIDLTNKLIENPEDADAMAKLTEMIEDMEDWDKRAEEISESLENNPTEAEAFEAEMLRIAEKMLGDLDIDMDMDLDLDMDMDLDIEE